MTDVRDTDDFERRIEAALHARAASATTPNDAWDNIVAELSGNLPSDVDGQDGDESVAWWRRPSAVAAAVAAAIAIVVLILQIGVDERSQELDTVDDEQVDDTVPPEDTAPATSAAVDAGAGADVDQYYTSFGDGALEALDTMIDADAAISDNWNEYDKSLWLKRAAYQIAQGLTIESRTCEDPEPTAAGTTVVCDLEIMTAPARPTGRVVSVRTTMTLRDGRIVRIVEAVRDPDWVSVAAPFDAWIETRPADPAVVDVLDWESVDEAVASGVALAELVAEWELALETHGCSPLDRPCTAETGLARTFIDARSRWDGESATSLVADSAELSDLATNADDYVAVSEFERAIGRKFVVSTCVVQPGSSPDAVTRRCRFERTNAWSEALGLDASPGFFSFTIENGELTSVADSSLRLHFGAWLVFEPWLIQNHPGDFDQMMASETPPTPSITPESIALWAQHTEAFVAENAG